MRGREIAGIEVHQCTHPIITFVLAPLMKLVTLQLKARFEMILDEGIATIIRYSAIAQICAQIAFRDVVFRDSCIELGIKFVLGDPCLAIERGVLLLTSDIANLRSVKETAIAIESLGSTSSVDIKCDIYILRYGAIFYM